MLTGGSDYANLGRMKITDLRKSLDLTQEQFAQRVGLSSKSSVSELETTERASVRVALEIERLSDGQIPAERLNPDVAMVRQADASQ